MSTPTRNDVWMVMTCGMVYGRGWIPMASDSQELSVDVWLPWNNPQSDKYPGKWHKCVDLVGWCVYIYIQLYTYIYIHIHIKDMCIYIYIILYPTIKWQKGPFDRPPPRACSVAPASVAQLRFGLPRPDTRPGSKHRCHGKWPIYRWLVSAAVFDSQPKKKIVPSAPTAPRVGRFYSRVTRKDMERYVFRGSHRWI